MRFKSKKQQKREEKQQLKPYPPEQKIQWCGSLGNKKKYKRTKHRWNEHELDELED